jgi:DNA-3-methyladenine glycosylase I
VFGERRVDDPLLLVEQAQGEGPVALGEGGAADHVGQHGRGQAPFGRHATGSWGVRLNRCGRSAGFRMKRCPWGLESDPQLLAYHDEEWGVPVHDDRRHFEFLVLEGAQAGLSWSTILHKRAGYARAFAEFDPVRVARFTPERVERLARDPGIVRNRRKIESVVRNAKVFLAIQREFGSFDAYAWRFVGGRPLETRVAGVHEIRAKSPESEALSEDLQRRGMNFVGPTIIYAHMQATGMVNDHLTSCFRHREVGRLGSGHRRRAEPAVGKGSRGKRAS